MADGRKKNGGARSGAGRKKKDEELRLITLMDAACSDDDWLKILKKIKREAIGGSIQHAKVLIEYRFGKPNQGVTISGTGKNGVIKHEVKHRGSILFKDD